eukprot:scaffold2377_cov376-Prasinococcus_capsulatus_cf.AAC.9
MCALRAAQLCEPTLRQLRAAPPALPPILTLSACTSRRYNSAHRVDEEPVRLGQGVGPSLCTAGADAAHLTASAGPCLCDGAGATARHALASGRETKPPSSPRRGTARAAQPRLPALAAPKRRLLVHRRRLSRQPTNQPTVRPSVRPSVRSCVRIRIPSAARSARRLAHVKTYLSPVYTGPYRLLGSVSSELAWVYARTEERARPPVDGRRESGHESSRVSKRGRAGS